MYKKLVDRAIEIESKIKMLKNLKYSISRMKEIYILCNDSNTHFHDPRLDYVGMKLDTSGLDLRSFLQEKVRFSCAEIQISLKEVQTYLEDMYFSKIDEAIALLEKEYNEL